MLTQNFCDANLIIQQEAYFMQNPGDYTEYFDGDYLTSQILTPEQHRNVLAYRQPYRDAFKAFKKKPSTENANTLVDAERDYANARLSCGYRHPSILVYYKRVLARNNMNEFGPSTPTKRVMR